MKILSATGDGLRHVRQDDSGLRTTVRAVPDAADWRRAARLLDQPAMCRCSTCALVARLGTVVREQASKDIGDG